MSASTNPRICIVTPAYLASTTVEASLRSVLTQSYSNFVISVVTRKEDSHTNVAVRSMAAKDSRIVLSHQTGTGISNARNQAIEAIEADIYAFLDADDEMLQGTLYALAKSYSTRTEPALRYCDWIDYNPSTGDQTCRTFKNPSLSYSSLLKGNCLATSATAIDAEIIYAIDGFNEKYSYAEDWELWLRIAREFSLVHVEHIAVKYWQTRHTKFFEHSFFSDEFAIIRSQDYSPLQKSIATLFARSRYGAYWSSMFFHSPSRSVLKGFRPIDVLLSPMAWVLRRTRFRFTSRDMK